MSSLKLTDYGTRSALHQAGIHTKKLARGHFTAVYLRNETSVWKLTTDSVSFEGQRDYMHSHHFPKMLRNDGIVGYQNEGDKALYLYATKKLQSVAKGADASTKRLAKLICKQADRATNSGFTHRGTWKETNVQTSRAALNILAEDQELPSSIREAFQELANMSGNYQNLMLDLHMTNLMVDSPDHLILNDVICDITQLH